MVHLDTLRNIRYTYHLRQVQIALYPPVSHTASHTGQRSHYHCHAQNSIPIFDYRPALSLVPSLFRYARGRRDDFRCYWSTKTYFRMWTLDDWGEMK